VRSNFWLYLFRKKGEKEKKKESLQKHKPCCRWGKKRKRGCDIGQRGGIFDRSVVCANVLEGKKGGPERTLILLIGREGKKGKKVKGSEETGNFRDYGWGSQEGKKEEGSYPSAARGKRKKTRRKRGVGD